MTVTASTTPGARTAVGSRTRRAIGSAWLLPTGTTFGLLVLWELLARWDVLPPEVPPLTSMAQWLADQPADGGIWTAAAETLEHWIWGLAIGSAIGVALGVAIGSLEPVRLLLQGPLEFLRPIPSVVYLPIVVLVIGATPKAVIILVSVAVVWPMLFQALYGVQSVDPLAMETARVFGLTRLQRLRSVTIRSIVPFLATGIRIASSLALVVAISIELIGGVPGLGYELFLLGQNEVYSGVYAAIFLAGLFGVLLNVGLGRIERRVLKWHVSQWGVTS